MRVKTFAEKYKLRIIKDSDGELIIPGRIGSSHIYEYSKDRLAVMFLPAESTPSGKWTNRRKKLILVGLQLIHNGDTEGTFLFDPLDKFQAQAAIKAISAKRKKNLSDEQLIAMRERINKIRNKTVRT